MGSKHSSNVTTTSASSASSSLSPSNSGRQYENYSRTTDWRHVQDISYDAFRHSLSPFDVLFVKSPVTVDKAVKQTLPRDGMCNLITHVGLLINHDVYPDSRLEKDQWYVLEYLDQTDGDVPDIDGKYRAGVQIRPLVNMLHNNARFGTTVYLACALRPSLRGNIDPPGMHATQVVESYTGRRARLHSPPRSATGNSSDAIGVDGAGRVDADTDDDMHSSEELNGRRCCACYCCGTKPKSTTICTDSHLHSSAKHVRSSAELVWHIFNSLGVIPERATPIDPTQLLPVDLLPGVQVNYPVLVTGYRMRRLIIANDDGGSSTPLMDESLDT